jgi:nucleotide-sensitive chloride channel 1A
MELSLNDAELVNAEDDIEVLEITVLPPNYDSRVAITSTCIKELFTAMNACSDLHPDPAESDEEGGEAGDTAPGAGGWITSDNMEQYFDEDGNFIGTTMGDADGMFSGGEALGPGAGTVRPRDDEEDAAHGTNGVDGTNGETEDTKWRRTT